MIAGIDPLLYVAFGAGLLGGRLLHLPSRWLDAATLATVFVLIGLLGLSLGQTSVAGLAYAVPVALATALVTLGATVGIGLALRPPAGRGPSADPHATSRPWIAVAFLVDFVAAIAVGRVTGLSFGSGVELALYALLVLVAWGAMFSVSSVRRLWAPILAAIGGALVGAAFLGLLVGSARVALATTFGFGFYSLSGPIVAEHAGATLGFVAFLANFTRENLTMLASPLVGRRVGAEGLAAMGGATSMDTTLYFVTHFGDRDATPLALGTGLVLTLLAVVTLPAFLGLPG